jgi:hypothetical protein
LLFCLGSLISLPLMFLYVPYHPPDAIGLAPWTGFGVNHNAIILISNIVTNIAFLHPCDNGLLGHCDIWPSMSCFESRCDDISLRRAYASIEEGRKESVASPCPIPAHASKEPLHVSLAIVAAILVFPYMISTSDKTLECLHHPSLAQSLSTSVIDRDLALGMNFGPLPRKASVAV